MIDLRHAFGFQREPFPQDVPSNALYPIPGLKALTERFQYALQLSLITVITGEVGAGKSTSLRHVTSTLHPAEYRLLAVIATTGTLLDLLRQICLEMGAPPRSSLAVLSRTVRDLLTDIRRKKQTPLLVVDEAHLLRFEVFAQLHTLTQFAFDSQTLMPLVLAGQSSLLDRLLFHTSRPLASRVVGRSHLDALSLDDMRGYLDHHLQLAAGRDPQPAAARRTAFVDAPLSASSRHAFPVPARFAAGRAAKPGQAQGFWLLSLSPRGLESSATPACSNRGHPAALSAAGTSGGASGAAPSRSWELPEPPVEPV